MAETSVATERIPGLRHGLIRASFVPPPEFRDARELTRFRRQLIQARTTIRNEILRGLGRQGIPLSDVLSNVFGASGMRILEALVEGRSVEEELPELVHRSVKGKRMSMATRKGNVHLTTILMECAGAAIRKKDCHLGAKFQRLRGRLGYKKALMAIARKLLLIIYRVLGENMAYREPEPTKKDIKAQQRSIQKKIKELEALGFEVQLVPLNPAI